MVDIIPVDVAEESVAHNLLGVRDPRAESDFGFAGEQFLQDRHGIARHVDRVEGFVRENGIVDLVFVFTAER